jgi:hypothetical protein
MYRRVPPPASKPDRLSAYRRLTPRDRLLLSWLAEHYLLSSSQIHRALFDSLRTAQMRLTILHRLDVVHRFAFSSPTGVTETPYLYTLGPVGLRLHPDAFHDPDNTGLKAPRSSIERADRIARSRTLHHLLGVNQFFVDLHAHTRNHPDTRLWRWWSEQHATAHYHRARIYPDGHGIWHADGHTVGFFLEMDRATENLRRVVAKLRGYERLAHRQGIRFPVLLWVPSHRRQANLLDALHNITFPMPIAVAVHGDAPAGPVWTLTTDPFRLRALHQLPADPGPAGYPDPTTLDDEDNPDDDNPPDDDDFEDDT